MISRRSSDGADATRLGPDDSGEATIISQLLIIGITAGIVFVAATYAYFAVDEAIREADHAGAQLALRAEMHRLEGIAQQGLGASTILEVPSQGQVTFSGYSPPLTTGAQDRVVVASRLIGGPQEAQMDGFGDGDDRFELCVADGTRIESGVTIIVQWHLGVIQREQAQPEALGAPFVESINIPLDEVRERFLCRAEDVTHQVSQPLVGVVQITVRYDNGFTTRDRLDVMVADLGSLAVETTGGQGITRASLVGNMVFHSPDHASSDLHASVDEALSLRFWALGGTAFSSAAAEQRMHVEVTDQHWVYDSDMPREAITIRAYGEHANGLLRYYDRLGGDTSHFLDATPPQERSHYIGPRDVQGDQAVFFEGKMPMFVHVTEFTGRPLT